MVCWNWYSEDYGKDYHKKGSCKGSEQGEWEITLRDVKRDKNWNIRYKKAYYKFSSEGKIYRVKTNIGCKYGPKFKVVLKGQYNQVMYRIRKKYEYATIVDVKKVGSGV